MLAFTAALAQAKSSQHSLKGAHKLTAISDETTVRGITTNFGLMTDNENWGLIFELGYDIALGYTGELLSFVESGNTFLALNPILYAEAFAEFRLILALGIVKIDLIIDLKPFRFSPLDY